MEKPLSKPILQLVTTGKQSLSEVLAIIRQIPEDAVDMLQIREKHRTARELTDWFRSLSQWFPKEKIFINDRVDVAAAVDAAGVQLAYHSLPVPMARHVLGGERQIGCSVHSAEEAVSAEKEGANFVIFGHIFATSSKPGLPARGLKALEEVVHAVSVPVIAIGGIEPENTKEVLATGCAGVAVMSSVFFHSRPAEQVNKFRKVLCSC